MDSSFLYPQVLPINKNGTEYEGFLKINGCAHVVAVKEAQVWCDWDVCQRVVGRSLSLSSATTVARKLDEISKVLAVPEIGQKKGHSHSPDFYKSLVSQIEEVGWDKIDDVNSDLTIVNLHYCDADSKNHLLEISWGSKLDLPTLRAHLPPVLMQSWSRQDRLIHLYHQFAATVERAVPLWRQTQELDRLVWVLEPERPTNADTMRRIAIGGGASLLLEIDPLRPSHIPQMQFLGPETVVGPLRERANNALESWSIDASVLENLKRILRTEFPSRVSTALEDVCQSCGVCYAFNLEGALPTVECSNSNCHQLYHPSCIFDWLRTLPSSRNVFNNIHGECPYCSSMIVTTVMLEK